MSYTGGITKSLALNNFFKVKTKFIKNKPSKNKTALPLDYVAWDGISLNNYSCLKSI